MENKIKIRLRLIIIKNEKILLMYDSIENFYFYVGGEMEFGETLAECCTREVHEECGLDIEFKFKKILYVRDFIMKEHNEHSLEMFVLGNLNKTDELEGKKDAEFDGKKWLTWVDINHLPENLYPKTLSSKLLTDYKAKFPNSGEYVGAIE